MKKHILLLAILLVLGLQNLYSEAKIEISLLTCSSGPASFETWGHSVIRINDRINKIDLVYDFGRFNFNMPNFYLNFIKAKLKYGIGIQPSHEFFEIYKRDSREVIEQILNLSDKNKEKIIYKLAYLCKPENRLYFYDFLAKNCTTQLRDLILSSTNNYKVLQSETVLNAKTYRDLLEEFMVNRQWLKFGINLILGSDVDQKVNSYEKMFLPIYLYEGLKDIKIEGKKLVVSEKRYNNNLPNHTTFMDKITPTLLFTILFCLILIFKSQKLQISILFLIGISGLIILVISIITGHQVIKSNFNLLWCSPLYIVLVVLQLSRKPVLQYYLSVLLQLMIVSVIGIWITKNQGWDFAFFLIVLILSIYNIRIIKAGYIQKMKLLDIDNSKF